MMRTLSDLELGNYEILIRPRCMLRLRDMAVRGRWEVTITQYEPPRVFGARDYSIEAAIEKALDLMNRETGAP